MWWKIHNISHTSAWLWYAVVKDMTFIWFPSLQAGLLAAERPDRSTGLWLVEVPPMIQSLLLSKSSKSYTKSYKSMTHIRIYMMDHDGSWWIMIPFNSMGSIWCLNLRHIIECPNIETLHQSLLTQIHKTLALLPANLRERSLPGFEEEGRSVLGRNGEGSGRLENVIICVSSFQRSWRMTIQSCHGT